jgi:site-specific DNA recombinase
MDAVLKKRACMTCGAEFTTQRNASFFCSDECRRCLGCDETNLLGGSLGYCATCYERHRRWRDRFKQCTCVTCGIEFTTTRTDAKFCSNACRQKAHRRAQGGRHPLKTTV